MHMGFTPKQYMIYEGRPIISYSLITFNAHTMIDKIIIVAEEQWQRKIVGWLNEDKINKFFAFSSPGESRQLSVYSGLKKAREILTANDTVIIHDAARPLVSEELITRCFNGLKGYDGVVPVLPAKDTWYLMNENNIVTHSLPRNLLVAGQAPEAFDFISYLNAHESLGNEVISEVNGSTELALLAGLSVRTVVGEEKNFKITTRDDLRLLDTYFNR